MSRPDRRAETLALLQQARDLIARSRNRDPEIVSDFWLHKLEARLREARRSALRERTHYSSEFLRALEGARTLAAYLSDLPEPETAKGVDEIEGIIERLLEEALRDNPG